MLLHLAAINEGMAAGFFSPADPAALAHLAGFPGEVAIVGVVTIGHSDDDPTVPIDRLTRRRLPIGQLVAGLNLSTDR
jgi:hypothetical protein